ncbi:MAG: hypothetical protein FD126_1245 [Elusimicrobia bacterium]|nr:MAG: hypothetical protein FD126_1245 [Elusimicrobiota bacterium]
MTPEPEAGASLSTSVLRQLPSALLMALYLCMVVLSRHRLERLAVEDGPVEWLTVGAFSAAAVAFGAVARRGRGQARLGAVLAAAFCVFVAGEEISWGERILGFVPPELFLRDNVQQELSLHNILQAYLKPKWAVVGLLGLWGAALPIALRLGLHARVPEPAQETAPPLELVPWALAGVVAMVVYPADFTGEFIELLTGLIMLEAALCRLPHRAWPAAFGCAALLAQAGLAMTDRAAGSPEAVACARAETAALFKAVTAGALDAERETPDSMDKRMYRAAEEGYMRRNPLKKALAQTACPGIADQALRDDLGLTSSNDGDQTVDVYSAGPNRRLDDGGDDIHSKGPLGEEGNTLSLEL